MNKYIFILLLMFNHGAATGTELPVPKNLHNQQPLTQSQTAEAEKGTYRLRLYKDTFNEFEGNVSLYAQHSIIYVIEGAVEVNGQVIKKDNAHYFHDGMLVKSLAKGTVIWRNEIDRTESPRNIADANGVESYLQLEREIRMYNLAPGTEWVFKLDSLLNVPAHTTGLHHHMGGSGFRCLLKGEFNVCGKYAECSENKTGDAWYEEGSYPVVSKTTAESTSFVRSMISHVDYFGLETGTSVGEKPDEEVEGTKVGGQGHRDSPTQKLFVEKVIRLR